MAQVSDRNESKSITENFMKLQFFFICWEWVAAVALVVVVVVVVVIVDVLVEDFVVLSDAFNMSLEPR